MKKIFALLIAVFMLSTVAFAAVDVTADDITYDGVSDTIAYTIKIANGTGCELGGQLTFDTAVFSFATSSDTASIKWSNAKKRVNIVGAKTNSDITITLNVLDKAAAKAGAELTLSNAKVVDSDAVAVFTASAPIVTTVKGAAGPAAPTYGTPVHDYSDVTVDDVIYQNVYVGTYTATPDTGATIAKVGVKAGETVVGEKDITVDGDATVSFKIALLGVEDGIDVGLTAFAEYAE